MRSPHSEKRARTTSVTFAMSPYSVLIADEVLLCDASGGTVVQNLPALNTVPGLSFTFSKIDSSSNPVQLDGNGGETINGQLTYDLTGDGDTVTLVAHPTGWRIIGSVSLGALLQSDAVQTLVLNRTAADFASVFSAVAAQTSLIDVRNFREIDCYLDIDTLAAATEFAILWRSSGLAAPNIATPTDWSIERTDNITPTSGLSATKQYDARGTQPNTYTEQGMKITVPVRGRWMSALVFVSAGAAAGTRGSVFFLRRI